MEERGNKTIICSVFFLDIIEYSKKSVSDQISMKERFNAFLSTAIRDVPINDRIILDTGDGAAISFLGDVEDALRAALSVRSSLLSEEGRMPPALQVRMGVNLGPVRLVKDINGQPNLVGDGINVAQRIMGFASDGQILVSRSYYDAASRLSQEYAGMFHYEGSRTDKHVREHEVYAIGYPGDLTGTQRKYRPKSESMFSRLVDNVGAQAQKFWTTIASWHNDLAAHLREVFSHASNSKKALYIGLMTLPVVLLVLLVVRVAFLGKDTSKALSKPAAVASLPGVSAASSAQSASSVSGASAALTKSAPVVRQPTLKEHPNTAKSNAAKPNTAKSNATKPKQKDATHESAKKHSQSGKVKESPAATQSIVTIKASPWGEVYLDGNMMGVSPPLTKLQFAPGAHVVEIRNTTFPAYKKSINLKAGEKINIEHKFGN